MGSAGEWLRFDFQSRKFKELVLYFSQRGLDEGLVIGSTKLNKLLFFTDFRAFTELGRPVTGARYQKLERGPAARQFVPMRDQMLADQEVRYRERATDDLNDVLIPLTSPNVEAVLSDAERTIADEIFEELRPYNATATSDYSHLRSAGWKVVKLRDDIPYESGYVVTDPPPQEAIELGRKLAQERDW
jgi:hypothetical protein